MNDLALLKQYEPIIRFTEGEMFFPCAVDGYLAHCSLWIRDNEGNHEQVLPVGGLSADNLGQFNTPPPNHTYYLRFVQEPLSPFEMSQWFQQPENNSFKAVGRLARVSLASRLIDSLFDLSLLIRGTVPGGTAVKAQILSEDLRLEDNRDVYYGRVIREGGYIILHYLFFYVMNNWRSGFYGVNDHEADWEQIFVYLSEEGDEPPEPRWVAYASHDFSGDDLRRRWDDFELAKDGSHPIIYSGAGSHASYFAKGEYLMGIAPAFLQPVAQMIERGQKIWVEQLGQGQQEIAEQVKGLLRVPFVDYARGDGVEIGPKSDRPWTPILLSSEDEWAERYRGLWGFDPQDFLGGERAPGGAKFNRDGSVRQSWSDPLGWSGLDKVPPPTETAVIIKEQLKNIDEKQIQLTQVYDHLRENVRILALETAAFSETDYQTPLLKAKQTQLDALEAELQGVRKEQSELLETKSALQNYLKRVEEGDFGHPHAHIKHTHDPEPPLSDQARSVDIWAALSSGMLVIALIVVVAIPTLRQYWLLGAGVVLAFFILIEATIKGRLVRLLLNVTVLLAIVSTLILIWEFWWFVILGGLSFLAIIMLRENLRELRRI
ncbi:MAG: hypothetical protein AAF490_05975 [Chloroflexota bacterium]